MVRRHLARAGMAVAGALAPVAAYSLLADGDDAPLPAKATASTKARAAAPARLIVSLPDIGRLTWRCDERNRFSATLRTRYASVSVTTHSDGTRLWRNKLVHPKPPGPGRLSTPFERVRRQTWRIVFRHKPATIVTRVRLRFAVSRIGECYAPRVRTDTRTDVHD